MTLDEEDKKWIVDTIQSIREKDAKELGVSLTRYRWGDGQLVAQAEKASMSIIGAVSRVGGSVIGVGISLAKVAVKAASAALDTADSELKAAITPKAGTTPQP